MNLSKRVSQHCWRDFVRLQSSVCRAVSLLKNQIKHSTIQKDMAAESSRLLMFEPRWYWWQGNRLPMLLN